METSQTPIPAIRHSVAFVLLLIAGAALYLFRLGYSDIWIDESLTKALVRHSVPDLVRLVAHDSHPPLYFIALKAFTAVAGNTDFTIRLFSVLGAEAMIGVGYVVGRRLFGPAGALSLGVLLLALPVCGIYTHVARMYTWAAFLTLCVFLEAALYARERRHADLIGLGLASAAAAYTHYYCLAAAFWIDAALLVSLVMARDPAWRRVALMGVVVAVAYVPWGFVLAAQADTVHRDFWIPPVTWDAALACGLSPFGGFYRFYPVSKGMAVVVYGCALVASVVALLSRSRDHRPLIFALVGFHATVATALVVSFVFRPVLYPRYLAAIAPLLMVPPVLVLMRWRAVWPRTLVLAAALACGLSVVVGESTFSFGPNAAALEQLRRKHPDVTKVLHVNEVTAGPLAEYGRGGPWKQYYVAGEGTSWYSNMAAFDALTAIRALDEGVAIGETFCLVEFAGLPLNVHSFETIVAQSEILAVEDVPDLKAPGGILLKLRLLRRLR